MPKNETDMKNAWTDPDDAPEWDDENFRKAEFKIGDQIVRPATGTYTNRKRPGMAEQGQ